MAISNTDNKVTAVLTAVPQDIPVGFYFLDDEHLTVTRLRSGVETELTLNADYTVAGAGDESGGTVTVNATGGAATDTIVVTYGIPTTQTTNYNEGSTAPAATRERVADKLTMKVKEIEEQVARSMKSRVTSTNTFPDSLTAQRFLYTDSNGDPQEYTAAQVAALLLPEYSAAVDPDKPTLTFPDKTTNPTGRDYTQADFAGQVGIQLDTMQPFIAQSTTGSDWAPLYPLAHEHVYVVASGDVEDQDGTAHRPFVATTSAQVQAALDACPDGGTIHFASGEYPAGTGLSIDNKSITVQGAGIFSAAKSWEVSTAYVADDIVWSAADQANGRNGGYYKCSTGHTSDASSFQTDLSSAYWTLYTPPGQTSFKLDDVNSTGIYTVISVNIGSNTDADVNIVFRDFVLDANWGEQSDISDIGINGCTVFATDSLIERVKLVNNGNSREDERFYLGVWSQDADHEHHSVIRNCKVVDSVDGGGFGGAHIFLGGQGTNGGECYGIIEGCVVEHRGGIGIGLAQSSKGVIVRNNVVTAFTATTGILHDTWSNSNTIVTGNIVKCITSGACMTIGTDSLSYNSKNWIISDNIFITGKEFSATNQGALRVKSNLEGCIIKGNIFDADQTSGATAAYSRAINVKLNSKPFIYGNIYNDDSSNIGYYADFVFSSFDAWATATSYVIGQVVADSGNPDRAFKCNTDHTSGATFAGDSANWDLYEATPIAETGNYGFTGALTTNRSETESIIVSLDDGTGSYRTGESVFFVFPHDGILRTLRFKCDAVATGTAATIDLKVATAWSATATSVLSSTLSSGSNEASTTSFANLQVGTQDKGELVLTGDGSGTCAGSYAIIEYERKSSDVLTDIDP